MRKILFTLCLIALITGCSKDDEPTMPINTSIGVSELVSYIGQSPQYVKDNFNSGRLVNEGGTLGKTDLSYQYKTNDCEYRIMFSSNTENELVAITVTGNFNTYSDGIEVYKKEMDLINESIDYVTYIARYYDRLIGIADFSDRNEFWQYVSEKDVNKSVTETWWLVNGGGIPLQYFTVDGTYDRETNSITVLIENKVYDF